MEEQRVNVIADFNEPPQRIASLGDGYRVEVSITVNKLNKALLIPDSSLFRHQRNWQVLSIVDCEAILHHVTIGLQNDSHTQTLKQLSKGDQVIVYLSDTLQPGTKVRPTSRVASAAGESQ